MQLLELARKAHVPFRKQKPSEKRRLLNFVLSNCTWKGSELQAESRQPFDMLVVANTAHEKKKGAGVASNDPFENWLPVVDSFRTLCVAPPPEIKRIFGGLDQFAWSC